MFSRKPLTPQAQLDLAMTLMAEEEQRLQNALELVLHSSQQAITKRLQRAKIDADIFSPVHQDYLNAMALQHLFTMLHQGDEQRANSICNNLRELSQCLQPAIQDNAHCEEQYRPV